MKLFWGAGCRGRGTIFPKTKQSILETTIFIVLSAPPALNVAELCSTQIVAKSPLSWSFLKTVSRQKAQVDFGSREMKSTWVFEREGWTEQQTKGCKKAEEQEMIDQSKGRQLQLLPSSSESSELLWTPYPQWL